MAVTFLVAGFETQSVLIPTIEAGADTRSVLGFIEVGFETQSPLTAVVFEVGWETKSSTLPKAFWEYFYDVVIPPLEAGADTKSEFT